jgi:hypothetical protein
LFRECSSCSERRERLSSNSVARTIKSTHIFHQSASVKANNCTDEPVEFTVMVHREYGYLSIILLLLLGFLSISSPQLLWVAEASSQTLYGCAHSDDGTSPSSFYTIDPSTGTATLVGSSGGMGINGCTGLDFRGGVLFAVGENPSDGKPALFTVNPATGIATLVGDSTHSCGNRIADISFRPSDGTLYGYLESHDCLGTINTSTGAVTNLGSTGDSCCGNGIAFDGSNALWHAEEGSSVVFVDTLDQVTGAAGSHTTLTIPSLICSAPNPDALAFSSGGVLYGIMNCGENGSGPNYLVTINTSTGVVVDVGQTANGMDGIAWTSTAIVPEYPLGLPLLVIFMVFAYGLIKRRTRNPKDI